MGFKVDIPIPIPLDLFRFDATVKIRGYLDKPKEDAEKRNEKRKALIDAINKFDNFEKPDLGLLECNRCGIRVKNAHYLCNLCHNGNYILCQGCADRGFLCADQGHDLMKRTIDLERRRIVNDEAYTPAPGIKVDIRGQIYSVIGDTGSEFTIISGERRCELGLGMVRKRRKIKMGNSKKLVSQGTVELPLQFPEALSKIPPVVAHVVRDFTFDILLGSALLHATETTTKFIDRFVDCLFPNRNHWAFNCLGKTTQRFEGMMGDGIPFLGLPDTGSRRNIMREDWALQNGFSIRSENENRGWVTFPHGPDEATIGQVYTNICLPDKKAVPVVFEVLPICELPVVLGINFVIGNDIYNNFPGAFRDIDAVQERNEMLAMGYKPWYTKVVDAVLSKLGLRAQPTDQQVETRTVNEDAELT
ncbi:hypothetical protein DL98DRAFT_661784 [Cadophora sp. DSE1049]|nr:hypothetical protein DL98DRAFT_661784 [Cadophora sp. DSE1049]